MNSPRRSTGWSLFVMVLLFPLLSSAQSDYDHLVQSIQVPEIDPRQYVTIYEWEPANENRFIKGIKAKELYIFKQKQLSQELDFYEALIEKIKDNKDPKIKEYEKQLALIQKELDWIEAKIQVKNYEPKKSDSSSNKGENNSNDKNKLIPVDYLENLGAEHDRPFHSMEEYYNHAYWKNGGTPSWEPIWWLNEYQRENIDHKRLDLNDPDWREGDFYLMPFQKYQVLDEKAVLRIVFDKNQLAYNEYFKGSISLEAELNGTDANGKNADSRPIEVNPYSMIGKEQQAIGLKNKPPKEIASNLVQLVKSNFETENTIHSIINDINWLNNGEVNLHVTSSDNWRPFLFESADTTNWESYSLIEYLESLIDTTPKLDSMKDSMLIEFQVEKLDYKINQELVGLINFPKNDFLRYVRYKNFELARQHLTKFKGDLPDPNDSNITKTIEYLIRLRIQSNLSVLSDKLNLELKILNYFQKLDPKSLEAFLNLIGSNPIAFKHHVQRFEKATRDYDSLRLPIYLKKEFIDSLKTTDFRNNLAQKTHKIDHIIWDALSLRGSEFHKTLISLGYDEWGYKTTTNKYIFNIPSDYDKLETYLAEKAGETLYQDLLYATIDLDLADAQPGDQLIIKMIWNKEGDKINTDTLETDDSKQTKNGIGLYVVRFEIKETGWKRNISDNALMIKRFNEEVLPTGYPLNPHNYKIRGGASLTWGYHNDHRTNVKIKTVGNTTIPKFKSRNGKLKTNKGEQAVEKFFKWLEPSAGLNITYLDYRTDNDWEIGIGPSVGLFEDVIYITYGWNLMVPEQSRYWGFGVSFLNLSNKISNK